MEKVSVIIPVYNVEQFLAECLDSVLKQSYPELEVICVNDGSTDSSGKILETYAGKDSRIIVVEQANAGLSQARNAGLQTAGGKFVIFLDSDDYFSRPDAIELLVQKMEDNDWITFSACNFSNNCLGKPHYIYPNEILEIRSPLRILNFCVKNEQFPLPAWNKMLRVSFLKENKISFPAGKTAEDIDWMLNIFLCTSSVRLTNHMLLMHRVERAGSITNTVTPEKVGSLMSILTEWKNRPIPDSFRKPFLSYLAYQYLIVLFLSGKCRLDEKMLNDIICFSDILQYNSSKSVRYFSFLARLIGFKNVACLLRLLFRFK